jgi:ACR3 family arsenite efflux pump ArsB
LNFIDNPLTALAIWALATMALAPLPLRYQILPGVALLLVLPVLPVLLVWVGLTYGVWPVLIGLAAAVSLFRKPLGVLWRRLMRGLR